ncbi:MAG: PAS domain S-box protein [Chakrabartia sp.]
MSDGSQASPRPWLALMQAGARRRDDALFLLILSFAYTVFAYIGLNWAMISGAGSPVWPAAGIGLAGLLIGGPRFWPAILIGRFCATLLSASSQPIWADLLIAGANVLGTLAPVYLIRRMGGIDSRLPSLQDMARYLFAGAALGAVISAIFGTTVLFISSALPLDRVGALFANWAIGYFAGAVTIGPMVLAWSDRSRSLSMQQIAHLLLLVFAASIFSVVVFATPDNEALRTWHLLPIMVWGALAFDVRGASLVLVIVSGVAVWATNQGLGPFSTLSAGDVDSIPMLQQFIAVIALTTLLLATIADERRAKEAMRAREERLRAAIEASGAGTFRWRFHPDVLDCDAALLALLGAQSGQPILRLEDLVALIHPDDRTMTLEAIDACLQQGADFTLLARLADKADAPRILHGQGRLVRDERGLPDYITGAFVDVTERAWLERRLQKAEETYRAVFEQAGVGVARLTLDGIILEMNDRFRAITGRPLKTLIGSSWTSLAIWKDQQATRDQMELLRTGVRQNCRMEKRYGRARGEPVWVDESLTLVRDQGGEPDFVLAVVQDITERKLAEQEVRLRADELEVVLRAVPAAIWFAHDPDCTRVTGNSFSSEVLRLADPRQNMSKTAADSSPVSHFRVYDRSGQELAPDDLPVQRAARGEIVRNFEERVVFEDGSAVHLLGNASPLVDPQGRIRGAVAAFIDISDRKRAEARERLLSREVDHRAKNVLAVVQAIVQLAQADSVATFRRMVAGRIQSLARTHNLLAENRWEGVELDCLIADELAPFGLADYEQIDPGRFTLSGPTLRLKPAAAQALALVIHELVTNAVKYGALSSTQGTVAIRWSLEEAGAAQSLCLQWLESGGPPIAPPGTNGFGWTVIRTSVEDQLGGDISTDWGAEGLRVSMRLPLEELTDLVAA